MPSLTLHHYLRPLVMPATVALVGASERPGSVGRIVLENILGGEFRGELFPVNPNHRKVLGRKSYASLAAIGKNVDLAVVVTPASMLRAVSLSGRAHQTRRASSSVRLVDSETAVTASGSPNRSRASRFFGLAWPLRVQRRRCTG